MLDSVWIHAFSYSNRSSYTTVSMVWLVCQLPPTSIGHIRGNPISKSGVLDWFRCPFAFAGVRVWNVSFWQKNAAGKQSRRVFKPRDEWVIVPDSHPEIITMEQAEQVYQRRSSTAGWGRRLNIC